MNTDFNRVEKPCVGRGAENRFYLGGEQLFTLSVHIRARVTEEYVSARNETVMTPHQAFRARIITAELISAALLR